MSRVSVMLLWASALCTLPASAVKLDDSMSPRSRVDTQMQWTHEMSAGRKLSRAEFNALYTRIPGVEIRLNTAAYVGRTVQIFLGVPVQVQGLKGPAGMRIE